MYWFLVASLLAFIAYFRHLKVNHQSDFLVNLLAILSFSITVATFIALVIPKLLGVS